MLHRRAFAFCVTWGVVFENEIYTIRRRASAGLMCRNRSRLFHIYFLVLFVVVGLGFRVTQRGRLSCLSLSERLYHRRRSGDMDSGEDVSYNRPIHCQKTRHDMRGEGGRDTTTVTTLVREDHLYHSQDGRLLDRIGSLRRRQSFPFASYLF